MQNKNSRRYLKMRLDLLLTYGSFLLNILKNRAEYCMVLTTYFLNHFNICYCDDLLINLQRPLLLFDFPKQDKTLKHRLRNVNSQEKRLWSHVHVLRTDLR